LCAAKNSLRFDWNDKSLKKARRELLDNGFIVVTRAGVGRRPTLYALCHVPVNEIVKHGIKAKETCSRRASGKREHYFPVRRDLQKEVSIAFAEAEKKKEAKRIKPNKLIIGG